MRRVGAVVSKHGATVIALHEHLMLFVATYIGQQRSDVVCRGGTWRLRSGGDRLSGYASMRRRGDD